MLTGLGRGAGACPPLVMVAALVALSGCRDDTVVGLSGGVTGQVCNPVTGIPAAGAEITASFTNPKTKKDGEKTVSADENGFFKVGGLPVTTVNVHVKVPDVFENDISDVEVVALEDSQLTDPACRDLPEEPGKGVIVGQICNRHTGDYVTDGTVTVLLSDGTTLETDTNPDDGTFELDGVPAGPQIVYVRAAGFQKTFRVDVQEVTPDHGEPTLLEDQDITCEPYDPLTTGMIVGTLCGTDNPGDPGGPLAGAHVFVTQAIDGITYEDETIDDGSFVIAGIPTDGTRTVSVRAEKGGFSFVWDNVQVPTIGQNPDGVDLTASVGCQPLHPDDGRKYLVVKGIFDRIEHVLDRMGIQPDLVEGNPIDFSDDWTQDAFGVKETLETYDAVFVNCGADESNFQFGLAANVKQNLREYVEGGGSLYVSDWAYDLVEQVWPEKINFLGDDTENSSAEHGAGEQIYNARVLEPGLEQYLGADNVDVDFKFDNFAVVTQVAPGVTTFLQADERVHVNAGEIIPNTPMTVGFSDGLGHVIFTSFHQEQDASRLCSQQTDCDSGFSCLDGACTADLDGPEDLVLRYLIFSL